MFLNLIAVAGYVGLMSWVIIEQYKIAKTLDAMKLELSQLRYEVIDRV